MTRIEFNDGTFQIDADILATAFGISESALQQDMRAGRITSLCERGEESDAGRYRLTFRSPDRQVRIVTTDTGEVLTCDSADPAAQDGNRT
jgi:hypothetical protein